MTRTYVVTGAASGIGAATADLLKSRGNTVIGVDIRDTDIIADLTTEEGRGGLADAVAELAADLAARERTSVRVGPGLAPVE